MRLKLSLKETGHNNIQSEFISFNGNIGLGYQCITCGSKFYEILARISSDPIIVYCAGNNLWSPWAFESCNDMVVRNIIT
jgi:hypothetical protein